MSTGLAQSVQVRLARHAKTLNSDPNLVLARYATERLLYRLSRSRHAENFVPKGALLLLVWLGETIRPTRDVDLLGFGELDADSLARTFSEICALDVEPDGLVLEAASIRVVAHPPGGRLRRPACDAARASRQGAHPGSGGCGHRRRGDSGTRVARVSKSPQLNPEAGGFELLSSRVREAIDRLKELRTTLISAAVTGKIDVRETAPA